MKQKLKYGLDFISWWSLRSSVGAQQRFFFWFSFLGENRCDGGSVAVSVVSQQKQAIFSLLNETVVIV